MFAPQGRGANHAHQADSLHLIYTAVLAGYATRGQPDKLIWIFNSQFSIFELLSLKLAFAFVEKCRHSVFLVFGGEAATKHATLIDYCLVGFHVIL